MSARSDWSIKLTFSRRISKKCSLTLLALHATFLLNSLPMETGLRGWLPGIVCNKTLERSSFCLTGSVTADWFICYLLIRWMIMITHNGFIEVIDYYLKRTLCISCWCSVFLPCSCCWYVLLVGCPYNTFPCSLVLSPNIGCMRLFNWSFNSFTFIPLNASTRIGTWSVTVLAGFLSNGRSFGRLTNFGTTATALLSSTSSVNNKSGR